MAATIRISLLAFALWLSVSLQSYAQSPRLMQYLMKEPPSSEEPMSFGMFDVLSRAHPHRLELIDEQRTALQEIFGNYRLEYKKLLAAKSAVRTGKTEMTEEELANVDKEIAALQLETENQAKAVLLPHQLDLATDEVLLGRLKRYGLTGLLSAHEINVGIDTPVDEVVKTIVLEQRAAKDELEELLTEFKRVRDEFRKKIAAIQRRQLELALIRLGEDGDKIRHLIDGLETE